MAEAYIDQEPPQPGPAEGEQGIPGRLFESWLEANLVHPQEGIGILAKLGEELYGGSYPIEAFARSELSPAQMELVMQRMFTAHGARGISSPLLTDGRAEATLHRLWHGFRSRTLGIAVNYASRALKRKFDYTALTYYGTPPTSEVAHAYARFVNSAFNEKPELRQELAELFALENQALASERVQALERERRRLLDYTKHGPRARGLGRLTPHGISRQLKEGQEALLRKRIAEEVQIQVARAAEGRTFSVDLTPDTIEKLFAVKYV